MKYVQIRDSVVFRYPLTMKTIKFFRSSFAMEGGLDIRSSIGQALSEGLSNWLNPVERIPPSTSIVQISPLRPSFMMTTVKPSIGFKNLSLRLSSSSRESGDTRMMMSASRLYYLDIDYIMTSDADYLSVYDHTFWKATVSVDWTSSQASIFSKMSSVVTLRSSMTQPTSSMFIPKATGRILKSVFQTKLH
jgi:hypothetical protein